MPGGRAWWHVKFRDRGYRLTIPRKAIIELLNRSSKHPSAEDIYLAVHRTYPAIGLTTVYPTLELLESWESFVNWTLLTAGADTRFRGDHAGRIISICSVGNVEE